MYRLTRKQKPSQAKPELYYPKSDQQTTTGLSTNRKAKTEENYDDEESYTQTIRSTNPQPPSILP